MTLSVAETCERAARRIEPAEEGGEWRWCQGRSYHSGEVCLDGALHEATGWATNPEYLAAREAMRNHIVVPYVAWNDAPGRTPQEVVAVLREVAAQAREGEG